MMGRMDIKYLVCSDCNGIGGELKPRSQKKLKTVCPRCNGAGKVEVCLSCKEDMPCSGTNPKLMDQSYCENTENEIPPLKRIKVNEFIEEFKQYYSDKAQRFIDEPINRQGGQER